MISKCGRFEGCWLEGVHLLMAGVAGPTQWGFLLAREWIEKCVEVLVHVAPQIAYFTAVISILV